MALSDSVTFDKKSIKDILQEVVDAIDVGDSALKLNEAKKTAGNDMMKLMQYVFPVIVQIEMDVIKKYGFIDGREGMILFTKLVVDYEKEDKDIAMLHKTIRSHYLPPVTVASENNSSEPNPADVASNDLVPSADL
ncbi:protein C10 [Diaphorina citri]|uniref:Protein C10 n=1 Tax=Diaphorina citri TaxID=121845 RepID=A0A1S3DJH4_DIACI|nr:protein C10 [Diaphorina citri]